MDEVDAAERRREFLAIMRGQRAGEMHPSLRTAYEANRLERRRLLSLGALAAAMLAAAVALGLLVSGCGKAAPPGGGVTAEPISPVSDLCRRMQAAVGATEFAKDKALIVGSKRALCFGTFFAGKGLAFPEERLAQLKAFFKAL